MLDYLVLLPSTLSLALIVSLRGSLLAGIALGLAGLACFWLRGPRRT